MTISFFIDELRSGGAEGQMLVLAKSLVSRGHLVHLYTFYPNGSNYIKAQEIEGLSVQCFWETKSSNKLISLIRHWQGVRFLRSELEKLNDISTSSMSIVYSFLEWPNILAYQAAKNIRRTRIVWGVRGADDSLSSWRRIAFNRGKRVSNKVDLVVANSQRGKTFHIDAGVTPRRWAVIENGIEQKRFETDSSRISRFEDKWNIKTDDILISVVGRLVEVKDHPSFIAAVAKLKKRQKPLRVFCAGAAENPSYESHLRNLCKENGVDALFTWMGQSSEITELMTRSQVIVLPSLSEGFPNVVCESMMCGTPVVSTDVGDARRIIGNSDLVVPVQDPSAMALAIDLVLDTLEDFSAVELRNSIVDRFSVKVMTDRTIDEINNILSI